MAPQVKSFAIYIAILLDYTHSMTNLRCNTYFTKKLLFPYFYLITLLKTETPNFIRKISYPPYKAFLEKLDPHLKKGGSHYVLMICWGECVANEIQAIKSLQR